MMIEIDLLPEEKRKKIKRPMVLAFKLEALKGKLIPIALGVAGLLLGAFLIVWLAAGIKGHSLKVLEKRWEQVQPQKKEAEALSARIKALNAKTGVFDDLLASRLLWSEKLKHLSDSMVPGVWLTQLSVEQKTPKGRRRGAENVPAALEKTLVLKGRAVSLEEEATATVGKFMDTIRENEGFFGDFQEIKLDRIRRRKMGDTEVMDFSIICYFKK